MADLDRDAAAAFLQREIEKERSQRIAAEQKAETIQKDISALIAEFANSDEKDTVDKLRKNIRARIPVALEVLDTLLASSHSDSLRANIAKWFVDRGLTVDDNSGIDDEAAKLNKLLESLR